MDSRLFSLDFCRRSLSITTQLLSVPSSGGSAHHPLGCLPSRCSGRSIHPAGWQALGVSNLNKLGLETIEPNNHATGRLNSLTLAQLHGSPPERLTEGVGMFWARTQETIVLILKDLGTSSRPDLERSSDGSNFKRHPHWQCRSLHPVSPVS